MNPVARERLFFADWLRIGAFGLLVLYHVGMLYVPWDYHVKHAPTFAALEPWMRLTNPWRMSLLFVVSGLATGLMLGRTGLLRERSRRLLLPLAFGMLVIVPPQAFFQVRDQFGYGGSYADFMRLYLTGDHGFCRGRDCLVLPTWNHLWFLPYLWCYTALLMLALRGMPAARLTALADAAARVPRAALLLAPVLALLLLRLALWPRFGETHALLDDWWAHPTYGAMFATGVLLARRPALLAQLEGLRWPALALALAGWTGLVAGGGLVRPAAFCLAQWCAIVAAFGFARRHLDVDHPWRAPLTEAVFPLYIVHQTLLISVFVALRALALPAAAEAALIIVATYGGGLLAWRLARAVGWLRPWMGIGRPRPAAGKSPTTS